MKIIPKIIEEKIVPKINEITYTVTPKSKNPQGEDIPTQIKNIGSDPSFNKGKDNIYVDPDAAVTENKEELVEDVASSSPWLKVFDDILVDGGVRTIKLIPYELANGSRRQPAVPLTADVINIIKNKFESDPRYQTTSWVDRAHKVFKNAGIGKLMTDYEGEETSFRRGAISNNEKTIKAFKDFINVFPRYKNKIDNIDKVINAYDHLLKNEGNVDRKAKGVGSTTNYRGTLDIAIKKELRSEEINSLIKTGIEEVKNSGVENENTTNRIMQLISSYRITSQKILRNSTDAQRASIGLEREIQKSENPLKSSRLDLVKQSKGFDLPENFEGDDLANANLLLTYAVIINNMGLAEAAFELKNRNVELYTQGRNSNGRFGGKLINQLKDIAIKNGNDAMVNILKNIKIESMNVKKVIMSERQAMLLSMLKEDNIKENTATDSTKDMGYRCPPKHKNIKNIDRTDYAAKLKDERESKDKVAQNVTKDDFGYKTPRSRNTFSRGKDINKDKEIRNSFYAKEGKTFTKKDLIENLRKE